MRESEPDTTQTRRCCKCGKVKLVSDFVRGANRTRCKTCNRVLVAQWAHSRKGKAWRQSYEQSEERRQRRRDWNRRHQNQANLRRRRSLQTVRGQLMNQRNTARCRLRRTADSVKAEKYRRQIAILDGAISRLQWGIAGRRQNAP